MSPPDAFDDDTAIAAAIAESLAPIEPAPDRRAALRERLLERARGAPAAIVTVQPHEGAWQPVQPGVELKLLHDHGDAQSFLLRMQPGARIDRHAHTADELCMVLEGEVLLGDVVGRAGTYHLALAGSEHDAISTRTGCLLFLRANLDGCQAPITDTDYRPTA
jgi:anti-sigma factor ChrR (cupin superfamily)